MESPLPAETPGELFEKSIARRPKKRRGVYFTPKKYAEMMAAAALDARLARAMYPEILRMKILDPACGGGAFLIAAYRLLLHAAQRALRRPLQARDKIELLESCIFGADVDPRALDVAAHGLSLVAQDVRVASSVRRNLVRGNALVDDVFASGGFDAVLANPPYVFGEHLSRRDNALIKLRYRASGDQVDLYAAFIELAITRLCKRGGIYAFIVPDAVLAREQRSAIRKMLIDHAPPQTIAHVGTVFSKNGAGVSAAVLIGERGAAREHIRVVAESAHGVWETVNTLPLARVRSDESNRFLIYVRSAEWPIFEALRDVPRLSSVLIDSAGAKGISRGEETGRRSLPVMPSAEYCVPVIAGDAIAPYALGGTRYFVKSLTKDPACYAAPKILARKTDDRLFACAEYDGTATLQSVYNLHVKPEKFDCVLAVLNSRFAQWFLKRTVTQYKRLMPQITQAELLSIPIPDSRRNYAALIRNAAERSDAGEAIERAVLEDLGIGPLSHPAFSTF